MFSSCLCSLPLIAVLTDAAMHAVAGRHALLERLHFPRDVGVPEAAAHGASVDILAGRFP
jgi:hypothetical protein